MKQLADEREGVVPLELASARGQDPQAPFPRQRLGLAQQGGLAQAGGRLDHREADFVVAEREHTRERLELQLTLD
jgi:hypothetical protein